MTGKAYVIRAGAEHLPLPDASVDLIVTSPPYYGLRAYTDGGAVYDGQIGSEPTPAEYIDTLVRCTAEWARVLKPAGSMFVNLGDKYSQRVATRPSSHQDGLFPGRDELRKDWKRDRAAGLARMPYENVTDPDSGRYVPEKSLMMLPERYRIACVDRLGLIARAVLVWAKPNGLPESVTDRVRRSHEDWVHLVKSPRYYSAVDEIREEHKFPGDERWRRQAGGDYSRSMSGHINGALNPLGKLPGSVWTIPTQPLNVPAHLGIDHFAAFPMEWPRRLIQGWSPPGICTACGQGRRPIVGHAEWWAEYRKTHGMGDFTKQDGAAAQGAYRAENGVPIPAGPKHQITGYACGCDQPTAPTRPAIVLDPFGGTGTTALLAKALGRTGITTDLSADYCRLATWRTNDPAQLAAAMQVPKPAPAPQAETLDLFGEGAA